MKKLFLLATVACLALSSCDDVPAPYEIFDINKIDGNKTSSLPYTNANLKDWNAVSVKGAAWDLGNTYAKITGYNNTEKTTTESEAWLVSPAVNLEGVTAAHIAFDHVIRYVAANAPLTNHTMWITADFSGDVASASWTQLGYKPVESPTRDWTFYAADEVAIPSEFLGKSVYVAFKFICGAENSTTWEINNLKIAEGEANIGGDTPPIPVEYEHISIADFIAKADANTTYEITGVASKLNATYASLDLTEDDATVYVYKMIDATGVNVDFAGLNIAEGDTVTVTGKYYKYEDKNGNVKHELNPGTYVRHKKANGGQVTPPTPPVVGDNLLANGDFETWADNLPTNWKTASSAGNATLSKSEDVHGGSFSVKVGGTESTNKRLAYKEITLTAGKYVFSFYAKGTLDAKTQTKGGYVPVTNGTVGSYTYASAYTDLNNKDWTQVSYEFTLTEQTTLALVVMNVKTSSYATAQDILVDDAVLTSSDGGQIVDGGEVTPPTPSGDAEAITVAEFLQKADANTTYRLTGVVKNIANTTFGNFDLEDATGKIYIYGLLDKNGATKQFASLGIKEGDTVTLEGKYSTYKDAPQIANAQYISHEAGTGSVDGGNTGGGSGDGGNTGGGNGGNTGSGTDTPSGSNILVNGDFETWADGLPTNWKSASSASNATLEQATTAHAGSYAVKVAGDAKSNKRLAYKEITLAAGTYTISLYAKSMGGATGQYGAQCRPGYATFNADGTINSSGYKYGEYANLSDSEWTLVTYEFTLEADQQICPLMMNPKACGDILVDDFSLIKK